MEEQGRFKQKNKKNAKSHGSLENISKLEENKGTGISNAEMKNIQNAGPL